MTSDRLRAAATRLDALTVTQQQPTALPDLAALLRAVADEWDSTGPSTWDAALSLADTILGTNP